MEGGSNRRSGFRCYQHSHSQDMYIHVATNFSDEIFVNQVNMMYDVAAISWLRQKVACIDRCETPVVKESRNLGAFFQSVSSLRNRDTTQFSRSCLGSLQNRVCSNRKSDRLGSLEAQYIAGKP